MLPTTSLTCPGCSAKHVSPKGGAPLHILGRDHVAYLDYLGSGNETARHSLAGGNIHKRRIKTPLHSVPITFRKPTQQPV